MGHPAGKKITPTVSPESFNSWLQSPASRRHYRRVPSSRFANYPASPKKNLRAKLELIQAPSRNGRANEPRGRYADAVSERLRPTEAIMRPAGAYRSKSVGLFPRDVVLRYRLIKEFPEPPETSFDDHHSTPSSSRPYQIWSSEPLPVRKR